MPPRTVLIDSLDAISARYDAILCDVWGVLHNGIDVFPEASAALQRARRNGLAVVLITNSPRLADGVGRQISALGVPDDAYDAIVTSGDVTRVLVSEGPRRVFHLGPDRDLPMFEGLDVERVEEFEASAVVCTGLFHDETETPDDYSEMLARLRARNLPFVCANPDIVVERGDRLVWCAGALARDYAQLGGRTLIAGKPHPPIYRAALAAVADHLGHMPDRSRILAIGDGMLTDVKGAADAGLDVLYVTAGIHARDYGEGAVPDLPRLEAFLARHGYEPVASIPRLQ